MLLFSQAGLPRPAAHRALHCTLRGQALAFELPDLPAHVRFINTLYTYTHCTVWAVKLIACTFSPSSLLGFDSKIRDVTHLHEHYNTQVCKQGWTSNTIPYWNRVCLNVQCYCAIVSCICFGDYAGSSAAIYIHIYVNCATSVGHLVWDHVAQCMHARCTKLASTRKYIIQLFYQLARIAMRRC